jgi:putative colanic acid biosynthesis acetyltransferase WcaF
VSIADRIRNRWRHLGTVFYNFLVTHLPSHTVRQAVLRMWGARIGHRVGILRGTTVLGIEQLVIGDNASIGFRCLLDARGGLTIEHDVAISDDVQFIAGHHLPDSDDFGYVLEPTLVAHHAWIGARSTVLEGVVVGVGAVVGACSLVRRSIDPMTVAAGIPAKPLRERRSSLDYTTVHRPKLL